jgi:hypothetical protein
MTREEEEQKAVDDWNATNEVGCRVLVRIRRDDGEEFDTATKSPAQMLCGTAAVFIYGLSGAYMLSRVRATKACIGCNHQIAAPFPFETGIGEPVCDECGRERNMH